MKTALFVAAIFLSGSLTAFSSDAPPVNAAQAAQLAQTDLESRNLQGKIYIEQILYKKRSMMNNEAHWEVLWNKTFPAQTEGRNEFGLRVLMDGTYKRAVR
ncbi:MAG: hypothetical protein AAGA96_05050 [Verrucomicrobiota bacterium]